MRLYDNPESGNCWKVRLMLARQGIAYERVTLSVTDRGDRETTLGRHANPALRVPTLEFDDGRHLAESNTIIFHLAETGDPELIPTDPFARAQMLQWMFFEQYDHEPNLAVARFWRHVEGAPPHTEEALAAKQEGGHRALRAMEGHLAGRDFFVGDRFSLADVSLYAYTHIADQGGIDLEPYPAVRAWLDRVAAQPGHVRMED